MSYQRNGEAGESSRGGQTEEFRVDEVRFEEGGDIRLYVLDGFKDGCNILEFRFNNDARLESVLQQANQAGDPFTFEIREKFGNGRCRIGSITVLS